MPNLTHLTPHGAPTTWGRAIRCASGAGPRPRLYSTLTTPAPARSRGKHRISPREVRPRFRALALATSGPGSVSDFQENIGTLGSWLDRYPYLRARTGFTGKRELTLNWLSFQENMISSQLCDRTIYENEHDSPRSACASRPLQMYSRILATRNPNREAPSFTNRARVAYTRSGPGVWDTGDSQSRVKKEASTSVVACTLSILVTILII